MINRHDCTIDHTAGTITAPNGIAYRYELRRLRRWNIGLRRHVMTLTGEITVIYPSGSYAHYADWTSACAAVARYSQVDAA